MKSLKPSMREKKRYLLISIGKSGNLREIVEKAILDFIGILGMSKANLEFIKQDKEKGKAIIAVNRNSVDHVKASFAVSSEKIRVERVSGTIKGLGK